MANLPNDADGDALARLAAQGADLSQPLLLDFAVLATDERSAHAIKAALVQHGYEAVIEYDEGEPDEEGDIDADDEGFDPSWTVLAQKRMVPTYDDIVRIQAELDRIAAPLGGRSDGWGTMLDS
jgi:hypothetical protein